jgi:hypothetical protein
MAQGDVELADRIAEAVNTRDLEWLEATAHPDLEYHPTIAAAGAAPTAGSQGCGGTSMTSTRSKRTSTSSGRRSAEWETSSW